jgi:tRNA threonylcarbamoyladenosine biosynthesis protein TsaE
MMHLRAPSLAATRAIASALAALARRGDVIVLGGEMGAGKTAFTQAFGEALGIDEPITSPTFTLVHHYEGGRLAMVHADLYRLSTMHEIDDLALLEMVEGRAVLLVEWGDVVEHAFGDHLLLRLDLDPADDDARLISLVGHGPGWAARWDLLVDATREWAC